MTENKKPVYEGSSRDVFEESPGVLTFEFKDTFSVFDVGIHHQKIPGKGRALCDCAEVSFKIAHKIGITTHFIERVSSTAINVKKMSLVESIEPGTHGRILPLEWITRSRLAGSLLRDFQKGKKNPLAYGLPAETAPKEGDRLGFPVHDFTTKREDIDRPLVHEEACELAGISLGQARIIWNTIDRLDGALEILACMAGFTRFDGKKEIAIGPENEIIIADTFGTPDEDRYVPLVDLKLGKINHFSKEMIRETFIKNGFFEKVQKARTAKEPDPPYPDLTDREIGDICMRYDHFAQYYKKAFARGIGRNT